MSKFKVGDIIRLRDDATPWHEEMYNKDLVYGDQRLEFNDLTNKQCADDYPDDFILVKANFGNLHGADEPKPRKHAELIKKWADGAKIEIRMTGNKWVVIDTPSWYDNEDYRVYEKKVPKTRFTEEDLNGLIASRTCRNITDLVNHAIAQYLKDNKIEHILQ